MIYHASLFNGKPFSLGPTDTICNDNSATTTTIDNNATHMSDESIAEFSQNKNTKPLWTHHLRFVDIERLTVRLCAPQSQYSLIPLSPTSPELEQLFALRQTGALWLEKVTNALTTLRQPLPNLFTNSLQSIRQHMTTRRSALCTLVMLTAQYHNPSGTLTSYTSSSYGRDSLVHSLFIFVSYVHHLLLNICVSSNISANDRTENSKKSVQAHLSLQLPKYLQARCYDIFEKLDSLLLSLLTGNMANLSLFNNQNYINNKSKTSLLPQFNPLLFHKPKTIPFIQILENHITQQNVKDNDYVQNSKNHYYKTDNRFEMLIKNFFVGCEFFQEE